jgi:hypothetical protein
MDKPMHNLGLKALGLKTLGMTAAAAVIAAFAFGASAQEKKAEPAKRPPGCSSLQAEADCRARTDCSWVAESKDAKIKRKAYCRSLPAAKKDKGK